MNKYFYLLLCAMLMGNWTTAQEGTWTTFLQPTRVNDYLETEQSIWVATDAGLYEYDQTTAQLQHWKKENTGWPSNQIESVVVEPQTNIIFIGTYDMQIIFQDGGEWSPLYYPEAFSEALTYDLEFDDDGNLWAGTSEGLLRYDGTEWTIYDASVSQGLHAVWDIQKDPEGQLWIAANVLFKYAEDSLQQMTSFEFSDPDHLFAYGNADVKLQSNGDVWFFTDIGSCGLYDGENWQIFDPHVSNDLPFFNIPEFINETEEGGLEVFVKNQGYFLYADDTWTEGPTINDLEEVPLAKFVTPTNTIECFQNEIRFAEADETNTFSLETFPFDGPISVLKSDQQNQLWAKIGTTKIQMLNGDQSIDLLDAGFEDLFYLYDFDFDGQGNCWMLSGKTVLQRTTDGNWKRFDHTSTILPDDFGYSNITAASNGEAWLHVSGHGIYHYDGVEWSKENHALFSESLADMALDSEGALWLIYYLSGGQRNLLRYDGENVTAETSNLPFEYPNSLHMDWTSGTLWAAGYGNELAKLELGQWSGVDIPIGPELAYIRQVDVEEDRILVALTDMVLLFDGEQWLEFSAQNSPIANSYIYGAGLDPTGALWITHSNALEIYESGISTSTTEPKDLFSTGMLVYPNPTTTKVQFDRLASGAIFNGNGQLVKRFVQKQEVIIQELPAGMYTISTIKNGTYRFIKL